MQKFCPHCGAKLQSQAQFCNACGEPVAVANDLAGGREQEAKRSHAPKRAARTRNRPRRLALFGLLLFLVSGALAFGYYYVSTNRPVFIANLLSTNLGGASPAPSASPTSPSTRDPNNSGMTTNQIRAQWAERALNDGRLDDAEAELREAERLEPGSRPVQLLRARLAAEIGKIEERKRAEEEERQRIAREHAQLEARSVTPSRQLGKYPFYIDRGVLAGLGRTLPNVGILELTDVSIRVMKEGKTCSIWFGAIDTATPGKERVFMGYRRDDVARNTITSTYEDIYFARVKRDGTSGSCLHGGVIDFQSAERRDEFLENLSQALKHWNAKFSGIDKKSIISRGGFE